MFAIYTLDRWDLRPIMISSLFMAEAAIFFYMMVREDIKTGKYAGAWLYHIAWLIFLVCSASLLYKTSGPNHDADAVLMLGMLAFGLVVNIVSERNPAYLDSLRWYSFGSAAGISVSGIFIGILGLMLYGSYHDHLWAGYAFAAVSITLVIVRQRIQANGLGLGLLIMNTGAYLIIWIRLVTGGFPAGHMAAETAALLYSFPFIVNAVAISFLSYVEQAKKRYTWFGVCLLAVSCAITAYAATVSISVFAPAVAWLVLSVLFLHASTYISGRAIDRGAALSLLAGGYMFLIIFLFRHVLAHLPSHMDMGPFPTRFVIAMFAVMIFIYWALVRLNDSYPKAMTTAHGLLWELMIVFTLASVLFELSNVWSGLVFTSAAFILLAAGCAVKILSRLRFYSLIMALAASIMIGFVSGTHMTPAVLWHDQGWITGCAAILVYFGFLFAYRRWSDISAIEPGPVKKLNSLAVYMDRWQNAWLFYPFFAALAMFMFWSFDKSLLTLLWVFEAFVIFILSIALKEQHFRYIAMGGLAGCLIRLVFYDLSKSTTLTRAIVFLGVGIIMLLINSLYNKYRDRYTK